MGNGDGEAVNAIPAHPDIQAVNLVGSTPGTGHVCKTGIHHGKRVQVLSGAKNHMASVPDAELDRVVDAQTGAAYSLAGARCMEVSVAVPAGKKTLTSCSNVSPDASACSSSGRSPSRASRQDLW